VDTAELLVDLLKDLADLLGLTDVGLESLASDRVFLAEGFGDLGCVLGGSVDDGYGTTGFGDGLGDGETDTWVLVDSHGRYRKLCVRVAMPPLIEMSKPAKGNMDVCLLDGYQRHASAVCDGVRGP
jgi:hypothetical protein